MKNHIFLLLLLVVFSCEQPTAEEQQTKSDVSEKNYPEKIGSVNDFEGLLDESAVENLEQKIAEVEDSTGYSIALATVREIPNDTDIVAYATQLGNRWEVGDEGSNGLVIVLSENIGSVAIAPGKGLEELFNDTVTQRIIDQYMIPYFRVGSYHDGLYSALHEIRKVAKAGDAPAVPPTKQ